ncbi:hypothetical protein D3C78_1286450 [compost metagenome]
MGGHGRVTDRFPGIQRALVIQFGGLQQRLGGKSAGPAGRLATAHPVHLGHRTGAFFGQGVGQDRDFFFRPFQEQGQSAIGRLIGDLAQGLDFQF